jgi:flavin reductase (DIM6/NTAB) family NADH-FMN oxidoreductase RutF
MIPPLSRPALASPAVLGLGDGSEDVMAALDQSEFRKVMGRFATGVTVITAEADGGVRGMTANAFMSGSLAPPLCIISVAKKAKLHRALAGAPAFGVSMLAQGQEAISRHFAGQGPADPDVLFEHMQGVPVLAKVSAAVAAQIEARHDCGDHTLFVGRGIALRDDDRPALVFHGGKYATLHYKQATSPAPFIDFWELDHDAAW